MPKSMGKGAASPSKFLMLQQKSPGLAQNEWKEHPSKLMGQQRRGTASCMDAKRLVLLTGQKDVREFTELRRSQRGAGLCGGAPVLHPQELRRESHQGHPCCGEGPGAVDGLAWQGHLLQAPDIIPHQDFSLVGCGMCGASRCPSCG